mgnify:CR=1 FL=1
MIIRKAPGENGTELYRIGTEDYISLRMANRFVFTAGGSFIAPEDVVSSEGKVYPTEIFLQARMATGSIDGAFAWLKGHPELEATGLVYNRVRLVQGQIVIDPPEEPFRLRDLGPEGDLVEQEHVYNIISNSSAQIWSVFIHTERLPESFRAFDEWALRLGEVEYDFSPNATNPAIYELSVLYAITQNIETIRNSQFFGRSGPIQTFSLTLNRNPVAGGAVSGAGQYVPGTSISVVASPGVG